MQRSAVLIYTLFPFPPSSSFPANNDAAQWLKRNRGSRKTSVRLCVSVRPLKAHASSHSSSLSAAGLTASSEPDAQTPPRQPSALSASSPLQRPTGRSRFSWRSRRCAFEATAMATKRTMLLFTTSSLALARLPLPLSFKKIAYCLLATEWIPGDGAARPRTVTTHSPAA